MKVEQIDPSEEAASRIDRTMLDWQKDKGQEFEQELRQRLGGRAWADSVEAPVGEGPWGPAAPPPILHAEPAPLPVSEPRPMEVHSVRVDSAPPPVVEPPPMNIGDLPAEVKAQHLEPPAEREVSSTPKHAQKHRPKNQKGAAWAKHSPSRRGKKRKGKHRRR